jgi:hypothetical protein
VAVEASSFTSAFADAPFVEQQLFFAEALVIQQAPDALPLHFPSASQADTGTQYVARRATNANRATNFFIKTSKNVEKNRLNPCTRVAQYMPAKMTAQCKFPSFFADL